MNTNSALKKVDTGDNYSTFNKNKKNPQKIGQKTFFGSTPFQLRSQYQHRKRVFYSS